MTVKIAGVVYPSFCLKRWQNILEECKGRGCTALAHADVIDKLQLYYLIKTDHNPSSFLEEKRMRILILRALQNQECHWQIPWVFQAHQPELFLLNLS